MFRDFWGLFIGLLVGTCAGGFVGWLIGADHPLMVAAVATCAAVIPLWVLQRKQREQEQND